MASKSRSRNRKSTQDPAPKGKSSGPERSASTAEGEATGGGKLDRSFEQGELDLNPTARARETASPPLDTRSEPPTNQTAPETAAARKETATTAKQANTEGNADPSSAEPRPTPEARAEEGGGLDETGEATKPEVEATAPARDEASEAAPLPPDENPVRPTEPAAEASSSAPAEDVGAVFRSARRSVADFIRLEEEAAAQAPEESPEPEEPRPLPQRRIPLPTPTDSEDPAAHSSSSTDLPPSKETPEEPLEGGDDPLQSLKARGATHSLLPKETTTSPSELRKAMRDANRNRHRDPSLLEVDDEAKPSFFKRLFSFFRKS